MSTPNTPQLAELLGLLRRARDPWARLRLVAQGARALSRLTPAQRADLLRTLGLEGAEELAELAAGGDPRVEQTLDGVLRSLESDPRRVESIARDIADPRKRRATLTGLAAHVLEVVTAPPAPAQAAPPPPPQSAAPAAAAKGKAKAPATPAPGGGRARQGAPAPPPPAAPPRAAAPAPFGSIPAGTPAAVAAAAVAGAAEAAFEALEAAPPRPAAPAPPAAPARPAAPPAAATGSPPPWTATPSRAGATPKPPVAAPAAAPAPQRAPERAAEPARSAPARPAQAAGPTPAAPALEIPAAPAEGAARPLQRLRALRQRLAAPGSMTAEALAELLDQGPGSDWARRRALSAAFAAGVPGRLDEALALLDRLTSPAARRWVLGDLAASRPWSDADWERLLAVADTPLARRRLAAVRARSAAAPAARVPGA